MSDPELHDSVEVVSTDDVLPYVNNPKEHPDEQVEKIAASIREFGFTVPLVIDGDGTIIAGHGRYEAATQHLDLDEVPVIRREDMTDAQAKAYRLADNRITESTWEIDTLGAELADLVDESTIDVADTGFDDSELEAFIDQPDEDGDDGSDGGPPDPTEAWEEAGIAEYEHEDLSEVASVTVKFESKADIADFADLVGETVTEQTGSIWFPPRDMEITQRSYGVEVVESDEADAQDDADADPSNTTEDESGGETGEEAE